MANIPPMPPWNRIPKESPNSVVEFVYYTTEVTKHIRKFLKQPEQQSFEEMTAELYKLLQFAHTKVKQLKTFSDQLRLDQKSLQQRTESFNAQFDTFTISQNKWFEELKTFQQTLTQDSEEKIKAAQETFNTAKITFFESTSGMTDELKSIGEFIKTASEDQKMVEASNDRLEKYATALEENKALKNSKSGLEASLRNLILSHDNEIAAYSTEGNTLDSENQRLMEQLRLASDEIARLRLKSTGDDEELRTLRAQSEDIERLQADFKSLKAQSDSKDSTIKELQDSVATYNVDAPPLRQTLQENSTEIKRLKNILEEKEDALRRSEGNVQMLETTNNTSQRELNKLRPVYSDIEALRAEHSELQHLRGKEIDECTTHTSQLREAEEVNAALRNELKQHLSVDPVNSKKRKVSVANNDETLTVHSNSKASSHNNKD